MKKFMKVAALLLATSLLAGCQNAAAAEQADGGFINNGESFSSERKSTAEITAEDIREDGGASLEKQFAEEHFIEFSETFDYTLCAQNYINENPDRAKYDFSIQYAQADQVKAYPVFGQYLAATDLVLYIFYTAGAPTGVSMLRVDQSGKAYESSPYSNMTADMDKPLYESPAGEFLQRSCYRDIVACMENSPELEILGVAYRNQRTDVIVRNTGESEIQFLYYGKLSEFEYVQPFNTIEEGRAAFAAFQKKNREQREAISVFPWQESKWSNSIYVSALSYGTTDFELTDSLPDYDNYIAIPLLNNDLKEDAYVLYLLYYHNDLVAEVVIDSNWTIPWLNIAQAASDGSYSPIAVSQYTSVLNSAQACDKSWIGVGVVFNGSFIPIGYQDSTLTYYDTSTNSLKPVD